MNEGEGEALCEVLCEEQALTDTVARALPVITPVALVLNEVVPDVDSVAVATALVLAVAEIECVGCAFAESGAKAAVILGGGILYGTCVAATGGACIVGAEVIAGLAEYGYESIPDAFKGKLVVAPKKSQNISVEGNAFGLKLK